jgi:hypothetical protein
VLINKGLIEENNKQGLIKGDLFKNYLVSKFDNTTTALDLEQSELFKKVSALFQKMASINETCENKSRDHIFKPVNQDAFLLNDVQLKCSDSQDIKRFASAIYLITFEKTKLNNKSLQTLPLKFQIKNEFIRTVDSLRHFFGGHLKDTFTLKPGQLSKADLLIKILNSPNNPVDDEYFIMQNYILSAFTAYLKDLDNFIKNPQNDSKW